MDEQKIKCLIWDLDNTFWYGTLLEKNVKINEEAIKLIKKLDSRGILNSIASKNESVIAIHKLKELGVFSYFVYPQIEWGIKLNQLAGL